MEDTHTQKKNPSKHSKKNTPLNSQRLWQQAPSLQGTAQEEVQALRGMDARQILSQKLSLIAKQF